MNTKRTVLLTSSSALAAGMAQAAVQYSGPINNVIPLPPAPTTGAYVDVNNDGVPDLAFGFNGYTQANHQKPYVFAYPNFDPGTAVLARLNATTTTYGLPVAAFGTLIDQNYLPPNLSTADQDHSYFDQDGNGTYVGDWLTGAKTDGYIGMEFFDTAAATTNYAWVHVIFDDAFADGTPSLTVVDYAWEDSNMTGIIAGSTNTVGAPIIYAEPQGHTVPAGSAAQLQVSALANPAPNYQWRAGAIGSGIYTNLTDGGTISGSDSATLNIGGALAANTLDYIVVVTNSLGAVTSSPPATLTLAPPIASPTPQVLYGGLTGHFHINVANGLPASYHWRQNGVNLSDNSRVVGTTTPNLAIANLQAADTGNYDVVLTAGSLSVTSTVASLSVLPANGESLYQAALLAARPLAYYPLNETSNPGSSNAIAFDNAGGYNGIYGLDVTNGSSGIAGPRPTDGFPGFAANNLATRYATNDPDSFITLAPWHLNSNTATFTAWINPANPVEGQINGILGSGTTNSSFAGIHYFYQATGANWDLGYAWNDPANAALFFDSQIAPPANQWSFVGLVITPSNATLYVFNTSATNSALSANVTNLVMAFATPEYIGTSPDGIRGSRDFEGTIDEVAVFNRSLGPAELQSLFNAALGISPPVTLQIARVGSNIQLTWGSVGLLLEASNVNGPWTTNSLATSPYTVSPTNSSKFYRVLVH